jgi:PAS domain S-box-containing protein
MNVQSELKANILYVDDDIENLSSFRALFRREYNIFTASSAKKGLEILSQKEVQVVITDQRMPEMTGTELLEVVAKDFPKTQRFLLTAYSDFDPLVDAINKGKLQGYFSKPIDDELFRRRIEEGLTGYYLERKNQELIQTIRQKEEFLQAVMENIPDGVFVKDAKTLNFIKVNKAWEEMHGYSRHKIVGKPAKEFFSEEVAEHCLQTDQKTLNSLCLLNVPEERIQSSDKKVRILNTKKIPILDYNGKPLFILGVSRDITELYSQQEREKRLQKQLIQSQKMEAIGTLAGGIAHDFNNILNLILGFTELALNEVESNSNLENSLMEIYTAGERGRDLVKQIMTFSRKSDRKLIPVKVKVIANEVLKLIRATISKKIDIATCFESEAFVMGDPTQIHQVFMNLCTNAFFAMQESGGILQIRLKDTTIVDEIPTAMEGLAPGEYLQITVADNGPGIPAEIIDSIFEPYFTTKESGQGTGMGLAIVMGIIESHGGKIMVRSDIGKGTQFTIYLPTVQPNVGQETVKDEDLPQGNASILFTAD